MQSDSSLGGHQRPLSNDDSPEANQNAEPEHDAGDAAGHTSSQRAAHEAEILQRGAVAAYLASLLPFCEVGVQGCTAYLEQVLADAGNPSDPLVRQGIEQLTLAHHRICALHMSAAQAKIPEAAATYSMAAARLMAEHRRTAAAIQAQQATSLPAKRRRFGTVS